MCSQCGETKEFLSDPSRFVVGHLPPCLGAPLAMTNPAPPAASSAPSADRRMADVTLSQLLEQFCNLSLQPLLVSQSPLHVLSGQSDVKTIHSMRGSPVPSSPPSLPSTLCSTEFLRTQPWGGRQRKSSTDIEFSSEDECSNRHCGDGYCLMKVMCLLRPKQTFIEGLMEVYTCYAVMARRLT